MTSGENRPSSSEPTTHDNEEVTDIMISGTGIEEQPLVVKPTETPGIYEPKNSILTKRVVRVAEMEDWVHPPVDTC